MPSAYVTGHVVPVLWSFLVSRDGALHRIHLIAPFPLGQNCPKKKTIL